VFSGSEAADILGLSEASWAPRPLHAPDRIWLETNCYIDVWAELLPALGHPVEARARLHRAPGLRRRSLSPSSSSRSKDLEALFGLAVQELAIYDTVESHTLGQLRRGRPVLIEVDSFWLPDAGPSYRKGHVKTTVAAIALDPANRRFGYFHKHRLSRAGRRGLRRAVPQSPRAPDYLFPYVEFVKRDGAALAGDALVERSRELLRSHLARRPKGNPIAAWRWALPQHLETLAARGMDYFHLYAFNLPRQLGANFEMMGSYLDWLGGATTSRRRPRGASPRAPRRCSSSSRAWRTAAASIRPGLSSGRLKPTMPPS
jgi:hypothetical protein